MTTEKMRKENWGKFWKVVKLMPLWFILPFTAFFKMQEVLMGKDDHPGAPTPPPSPQPQDPTRPST